MNYASLLILPYASVWSGLRAFKYHPDRVEGEKADFVDDLREMYLPAASYGSAKMPLIQPTIATMPGLKEKNRACYDFFVERELYIINSHRFTFCMLSLTACAVAAVFLSTLGSGMVTFFATGAVVFSYMVATRIIYGYYETKADDYVLEKATPEQLSAVLGFINELKLKAVAPHKDIKTFQVLEAKLREKGVTATPCDSTIFEDHDKRVSSLGLPYAMRPKKYELTGPSEELFYQREAFHQNIESSDLCKFAALIGVVTVTSAFLPAKYFLSPITQVGAAIAFDSLYVVMHRLGDHYFKWKYDPKNEIGEYMRVKPLISTNVYRGAY